MSFFKKSWKTIKKLSKKCTNLMMDVCALQNGKKRPSEEEKQQQKENLNNLVEEVKEIKDKYDEYKNKENK